MKKDSFTLWTYHGPSTNFEETLTGGDEKIRCKITAKNCVRSNLLPTLDQKRYQSVKFNKLLSKRQLQGMIKQSKKTRVTIFRLANTSLHQVYYEDHEITECLSRYAVLQWEMMEVMMLMHGSILPATTNPPPLPPFRHILGHFQPFRAGAGDFFWGGPGQRAASRRRKAARRHLNRAVRYCSRGRKNLESIKHLGNMGSLYTRA